MSQIKDIKRGNINGVAADMAVDFCKEITRPEIR